MRAGALRGMPRDVIVLSAVAFAVAVGFGVVAPALPVFARDFGVGRTAAGAVISAFAIARLLFALTSGRLVDTYGERTVLASGIAVVAVSSLFVGLAQNYVELLLLRGIGGVGSAMFSVSAYSLLLGSAGPEQRGRASGLFQGAFLLGAIAGPALGGFVTGINIRAPFFLYAVTLTVAGLIGLLALSRRERPTGDDEADAAPKPQPVPLATAFRQPAYRAALLAALADTWAVLGVRSALVPLFVTEVLHRQPLWIGAGFVVVAAVNALVLLPAGRFADDHGRRPVLVAGCTVSAIAVAVLAMVPDLGGYLLAMAVAGVGSGLLDVAPAAIVGDVAGGRGGRLVAAYQMAGDTGVILGPVVAGLLADAISFRAAFLVTAAVLGLAAIVGVASPEYRR
ncbi:MAG: MFS transporter [Frankiaceae bacterium]